MSHQTEIVETKKLHNGQFSVLLRCCGTKSTDYWATLDAKVMADKNKRDEAISNARLRVAQNHETAMQAEEALIELAAAEPVKHD